MKFPGFARILLTLAVCAAAVLVGRQLWLYYMDAPWTRDGRLRVDVVGVAPDVSGLVDEVLVRDNQVVHAGDLLFRIDRQRFTLALKQAEAAVANRQAALDVARRDVARYHHLDESAVSRQKVDQVEAEARQAEAALDQAIADRDLARLELARSEVRTPVDGIITNFSLNPGDYARAGSAVAALVKTTSLHAVGYFEETKLHHIRIGAPVTLHLMGEEVALKGHVESIAAGIEDRERQASNDLLPNVNPTFSWVRLAQRIPVRIALDGPPPDLRLVAGRTVTVRIDP
ncbi:HlyD family secretion protein [Oleisolibacter albus]|uniref:efflux RND transporter periplasmic adaptor subunit n=1 Tax=Oleisolibacter albus TaxID=2171757 RepID=UPI000DF3A924|nr:HlyD family secretion protein [Oleisolibacter albus]